MPNFNASQQEAISAQNQNILVSAAAGSGKTTVMVEKIKQTLIDDAAQVIATGINRAVQSDLSEAEILEMMG